MKAITRSNNIPLITCAILAALSTGGPTYAFGLYGASLKESLSLTQAQLDTLSSANFCAGLITFIPGLLVDRYGVRSAMSLGGLMGAVFMSLYWVIARQWLVFSSTSLTLTALSACGVASCVGNGLVIGSIYKILVCTCTTTSKGSAVGAAKGYVGLGSGVYACFFQAIKAKFHPSSDLDFLPMAALLALCTCTIPALVLLPPHEEMQRLWSLPIDQLDQTNRRHFTLLYMGLFLLGIMVVTATLADLPSSTLRTNDNSHFSGGVLILTLWLAPLIGLQWIPNTNTTTTQFKDYCQTERTAFSDDVEDSEMGEQSTLMTIGHDHSNYTSEISELYSTEEVESMIALPSRHDNPTPFHTPERSYTLKELLKTCHAWLLLWVGLVLVGSGTMMTNNMAQMVESLLLPVQVTTASMAVFSVSQAASRILAGAVSDLALSSSTRYPIPRPFFLVLASLFGALAHTVLAMTPENDSHQFLIGVVLSGIAFGMTWPLMVLIVGEVFGTAHVATNYLFYDGLASAMGTLLLSKFVTQAVYEAHIEEAPLDTDHNDTTCYGAECFQASHWAAVILTSSCVLASIYFLQQTRNVYTTTTTTNSSSNRQ